MKDKLLESLNKKTMNQDITFRRYALSEIISESYNALYDCEKGSNLHKLAEAHIEDIRSNPTDIDRLSRQLCKFKHLKKMVESKELEDEGLLVPEESHDKVENEEIKESEKISLDEGKIADSIKKLATRVAADTATVLRTFAEAIPSDALYDFVVNMENKAVLKALQSGNERVLNSLTIDDIEELMKDIEEYTAERKDKRVTDSKEIEDTELTDEETAELAKHLADIRKNKKTTPSEKEDTIAESKSWDDISLTEFNKKSAGKAFVKTFKKLDAKLHEGTALTRQESISLYKAANSAMTHLSVELEHNPEFLDTFKESVSLLSADVAKLLESMKNGKAPSKSTMKSLAKFSESLLREADEDEELPPIEDEENEFIEDEEVEEFDQEYADARVEIHKELAEEHADDENPEVQEKLAQDAAEIAELPGVTEEQLADIDIQAAESEEAPIEGAESDEEDDLALENADITEDELAELKKHLTEMRREKKLKESGARRLMKRSH